ncbi:hypothetical protein ACW4TU_41350 [Streptomyces sp. QTS52]
MSTPRPVSLQWYDNRGMPVAPTWDRAHLVDKVINAYAFNGTELAPDVVDLHLAEAVDKAACSLLRDQWKDGFPVAAYSELLSAIAALRSLLGYAPTPTARDVHDWARALRDISHEAVRGVPADLHEVSIVEGPHRGVALALWGPKESQATDALPGPPLTLELPIVHGDSVTLEHDTAFYSRLKRPNLNSGQWEFWLDRSHEFPAEGSRPHMLPITPDQGGRA